MDGVKEGLLALAKANVEVAEKERAKAEIDAGVEKERIKSDTEAEKHAIDAAKEGAFRRETTLKIVLPLCVVGLFAFLSIAIWKGELKEAIAALPQLVMAFAFVAVLWQLREKKKKPKGKDDGEAE